MNTIYTLSLGKEGFTDNEPHAASDVSLIKRELSILSSISIPTLALVPRCGLYHRYGSVNINTNIRVGSELFLHVPTD